MVVILHNIRSIFNVGSIFRTADGCGIGKLYLCGITPAPLDRFGQKDPRFAKVALGAEKVVLWERVASIARLIDGLKEQGWFVVALEQDPEGATLSLRTYQQEPIQANSAGGGGGDTRAFPRYTQ